MSKGTRWIAIVVGLLVVNALAVAILILASGSATKSKVLPGYSTESWKK